MELKFTDHDYQWMQARESFFRGNNRLTKPETEELFRIWYRLTGQQYGTSRCGRCVAGVRSKLWKQYLKERDNPNIISEQNL